MIGGLSSEAFANRTLAAPRSNCKNTRRIEAQLKSRILTQGPAEINSRSECLPPFGAVLPPAALVAVICLVLDSVADDVAWPPLGRH